MSSALVPLHLGDLHAYETALLVLLAFGPFVVLGVVVGVVRRRDLAEEERDAAESDQAQDAAGSDAAESDAAESGEEPAPATEVQAPSGSAPGADRPR